MLFVGTVFLGFAIAALFMVAYWALALVRLVRFPSRSRVLSIFMYTYVLSICCAIAFYFLERAIAPEANRSQASAPAQAVSR